MEKLINFLKGRVRQATSLLIVIIFFSILLFSIMDAVFMGKHELAIGVLSVCFTFSYLMLKIPKIKDFFVGGKHLNISVNQKKAYCYDHKKEGVSDYDEDVPKNLS